jgi:hypothetical protein
MDRPSLAEVMREILDARAAEIHTAIPGRVESYDATTQTADVQPLIPAGLPVVPSVPVRWPAADGGASYLILPLAHDDTGLLICCERDIREWRRTGERGDAPDLAVHGLGSATFLPDLRPASVSLPTVPPGVTVLAGADLRLGAPTATKAAMHEDTITAITTWAAAVSAAITTLGGDITAETAQLGTDLAASKSPSVRVED